MRFRQLQAGAVEIIIDARSEPNTQFSEFGITAHVVSRNVIKLNAQRKGRIQVVNRGESTCVRNGEAIEINPISYPFKITVRL